MPQLLSQVVTADPEIDEPGPGDLGVLDLKGGQIESCDELTRDVPRRPFQLAGDGHGQVGGHISVRRFPRPLEPDLDRVYGAQLAGDPLESLRKLG